MQIRSYSRYILVVLCIAVAFTALVIAGLNVWMEKVGQSNDRYREGYNAARQRLRESGLYTTQDNITELLGIVMSIEEDLLVVQQISLDADPLADGVPDERTIIVLNDTKIYSEFPKPEERLAEELASHTRTQATDPDQLPPSPNTQEPVALSSIPVGSLIRVVANVNVQFLEIIPASEIALVLTPSIVE